MCLLLHCRPSLCGTSCLPTTWTRTLWSGGGSAWRTFCCEWRHTRSCPTTRSSTTSSLRYSKHCSTLPAKILRVMCAVKGHVTEGPASCLCAGTRLERSGVRHWISGQGICLCGTRWSSVYYLAQFMIFILVKA